MTVADNETAAPTAIDAVEGDTMIVVATGGADATVTLEAPDCPEHVAVIVADPVATPVTAPPALTVALAALLVDHVTLCPLITLPCASFTDA